MRTLLGAGGSDRHRRWRSVSALHTSETSVDEAQSICKRNTRSATVASCSPAFPAKPPKRPAPAPAASAPVPVLHISRIGARTAPTGDGARVAVPASSWPASLPFSPPRPVSKRTSSDPVLTSTGVKPLTILSVGRLFSRISSATAPASWSSPKMGCGPSIARAASRRVVTSKPPSLMRWNAGAEAPIIGAAARTGPSVERRAGAASVAVAAPASRVRRFTVVSVMSSKPPVCERKRSAKPVRPRDAGKKRR